MDGFELGKKSSNTFHLNFPQKMESDLRALAQSQGRSVAGQVEFMLGVLMYGLPEVRLMNDSGDNKQ